jgi:hypothetical protein
MIDSLLFGWRRVASPVSGFVSEIDYFSGIGKPPTEAGGASSLEYASVK